MIAYRYDINNNNMYIGETEAFLDPLESEKQKKEVYALPAESTFLKPLKKKKGYDVCFNGTKWEYVKIEVPPEPEPEPEPTPKEIKEKRINELLCFLDNTDWYDIRWFATKKQTPAIISENRQSARDEISRLREEIAAMDVPAAGGK